MKYQYDHTDVDGLDYDANGIVFTKDGKTYRQSGQAVHSNNASAPYTYQADLICDTDPDFEGRVYWDVVNAESDDESDACDWDKFDVHF